MHQLQTILLEESKQLQFSPPGIHKHNNSLVRWRSKKKIAWSDENIKDVNSPGFIKKRNNATWFLDTEKR